MPGLIADRSGRQCAGSVAKLRSRWDQPAFIQGHFTETASCLSSAVDPAPMPPPAVAAEGELGHLCVCDLETVGPKSLARQPSGWAESLHPWVNVKRNHCDGDTE